MKTHISDANKAICEAPRTNSCLTAILDADGFVDQSNCPERWVSHSRELERELDAANERIAHLIELGLETSEYGLQTHRELWEKEAKQQ